MIAELTQDKDDPSAYRVEAIAADGACEVAVFGGPHALDRAIMYASAMVYEGHYGGWTDPTDLANPAKDAAR